ncbi:MAG TPA: hypothetical protein VFJ70_23460 [Burkholderiales bacterium]|nr:hypothetical protein [Burkholderiales bacterium]
MAVLSDLRELIERLRPLGALVLAAYAKQRVAVVDSNDTVRGCVLSELEARRRGYELRYFGDLNSALAWLHATRSDA